jgi:hypothetical protein
VWIAYGYDADGRLVPIRLVLLRENGHVELGLLVGDQVDPTRLDDRGVVQLITHLRNAAIERGRRDRGQM